MGIDHSVFANVSAHIDEHWRHANNPASDVGAIANAGAAGDDAYTVGGGEGVERVSGFVEKRELRRIDGHIHDGTHAETEEDSLLYPGVGAPTRGGSGIRLRSADGAAIQRVLERCEERVMLRRIRCRRSIEERFNLILQHGLSRGD